MKFYKTYIKNDLHVSLTRLANDEIRQKTRRKPIKTSCQATTPRPVTVKANPTAARKYIFKLKRYGVRHKNHKNYHHTCMGKKCHAIFKSLQEWNEHHRHHHPRLTYMCRICSKICLMPSSFRDHKYYHGVKKFECGQCRKLFMNASQLNIHKHFHRRDRLYKCFASKCKGSYKWPQDLLRHIKVHLSTVYRCMQFPYSNKQKLLLLQHINIHTDDLPFQCCGCASRFKHAMQRFRHEKSTRNH